MRSVNEAGGCRCMGTWQSCCQPKSAGFSIMQESSVETARSRGARLDCCVCVFDHLDGLGFCSLQKLVS